VTSEEDVDVVPVKSEGGDAVAAPADGDIASV